MLLTRVPVMAPAGASLSSRRASGANAAGAATTAARRRRTTTAEAAAAAMRRRQPTAASACSTSFFSGSYSDASRLDVAALSASTSYSRRGSPSAYSISSAPRRKAVTMGNKGATGPFAPLVVAIRNVYGTKNFNLLRGKAISLHSQVIKEFGKSIGVDSKQVQGLIRLAKKNGEKLGFLA